MAHVSELNCVKCKQLVAWGPWLGFYGVLDHAPFVFCAESRRGTCGCTGKGYVQARELQKAEAA